MASAHFSCIVCLADSYFGCYYRCCCFRIEGRPSRFVVYSSFPLIVLLDFSLTVKAATLIFISGRGSAISSAEEGKLGFIYNLVNS